MYSIRSRDIGMASTGNKNVGAQDSRDREVFVHCCSEYSGSSNSFIGILRQQQQHLQQNTSIGRSSVGPLLEETNKNKKQKHEL